MPHPRLHKRWRSYSLVPLAASKSIGSSLTLRTHTNINSTQCCLFIFNITAFNSIHIIGRVVDKVASKFNRIFLIILSLQLCAAILLCNGMSMTLEARKAMTRGIRVKEPLYYNVSGVNFIEYYIKLSVGTPPQDLLVVMDTGSSVVWASCTPNYTCNNCPGFTTVFLPNKSSSALPLQCANPKCREVCEYGESGVACPDKCSGTCPDYALGYGSGSTNGHLLIDTFTLPSGIGQKTNFAFGCSVVSYGIGGIAGFGTGNVSLPSQLSTVIGDKFGYCLNDQGNGSMIVLGDNAVPTNMSLKYTLFLNKSQSPSSFAGYNQFYYIGLEGVGIGAKSLTLPSTVTTFDSNGEGGTVIDSGTSYTIFPQEVHNQIAAEFASQIRYPEVEVTAATANFGLCYNVSGVATIQFPEFAFHFSGGSNMVLPQGNSFVSVSSDTYCLAFIGYEIPSGPLALLGNYQQRNIYILYDREMNRLGFTQQAC